MVLKQSRICGNGGEFSFTFLHYIHFALGGKRGAQEERMTQKKGRENKIPEAYSVEAFFVSDGGKTLLSASQCLVRNAFRTNNGRLFYVRVCECVWLCM